MLILAPALVLIASAIVSYRTGLAESQPPEEGPWFYLLVVLAVVTPPWTLYYVLFGGFRLAGRLPAANGLGRVRTITLTLGPPIVCSVLYGNLVDEVPFLQDLAC